jgi:hypothetical protein
MSLSDRWWANGQGKRCRWKTQRARVPQSWLLPDNGPLFHNRIREEWPTIRELSALGLNHACPVIVAAFFFNYSPPTYHISLPGFEPDLLLPDSAGSAPEYRPASLRISEETIHARAPACGTHPLQ